MMGLFMTCEDAGTDQIASEEALAEQTGEDNYYQEPHRPQFHFSPAEKWMNDPNGMVYYEGEYHLFYQYHPDSTIWGPMHWGHAVSTDLVHWKHLPIGIYPDSLGLIFSGSAVVDWQNTSGFGQGGKEALIAIFTHHLMEGEKANRNDFQYQSIAYSNDKGRSWTMYEGNPVIPNNEGIRDFRDPKVIWDEESEQWVMVFAARDRVKIWGSKDLKDWYFLSDWGMQYGEHGGVWECPDFFPMQVVGTNEQKWVLLQSLNPGAPNGGSGTQYFVGDFDGKNFLLDASFEPEVSEGKAVWLDYGRDNYAGVTWSDIPVEDGRRIFMGWMSNWDYAQVVPTEKWRSAMTLARSLTLHKTDGKYRIYSQPVTEQSKLRGEAIELNDVTIDEEAKPRIEGDFDPAQSELILEVDLKASNSKRFGIELTNDNGETYRFGFDTEQQTFFSDRTKSGDASFSEKFARTIHSAPRIIDKETLVLQLFFDAASIEAFADEGATVITDIFFPSEDFNRMQLFSEGGTTTLLKGTIYPLDRIWEPTN